MQNKVFTAISAVLPGFKTFKPKTVSKPDIAPSQNIITVNTHDIGAADILSKHMKSYLHKKFIVLCIGTDLCIGDCLGPLIGSRLLEYNIPVPVLGTLKNPVHAVNFNDKLSHIRASYPEYKILAVDAALSASLKRVGLISFERGCLHPGIGAGNVLPPIGDLNITGIVNTKYINPLSDIRLSLVVDMANVITDAIAFSFLKR